MYSIPMRCDFFELLKAGHEHVDIIGRSLGSGVTAYVAAKRQANRLVLITPYDSIRNVAAMHYPWLPVRGLIRDPFPSDQWAAEIDEPTLFIVAGQDRVIANSRSAALEAAFKRPVEKLMLVEASHHDLWRYPAYPPTIQRFLAGGRSGVE